MSTTFKFGAGKWAAKEGSVLAYNDLNDNFKPLPFTFTRASTATRVNESGLIESVASGVPRIDFLDNADGHLLLEPSRTNLLTYSEDFSNAVWVKTNVTVSANSTSSPDGSESADSVVSSASNVAHFISTPAFTVSSAASYTTSIFAKYNGTFMQITFGTGQVSGNPRVNFDLQNGVLGSLDTGISASIDSYGNGWYKLTATVTTATTSLNVNFVNIPSSTSSRVQAYEGDGVSGAYLWGAQLEAGSYATSYIPTSGSSVTRAAEVTYQDNLPTSVISSSYPFTVYAEGITVLDASGVNHIISFANRSSSSEYFTVEIGSDGVLVFDARANGVSEKVTSSASAISNGDVFKFAFAMESATSGKFCVNGVLNTKSNYASQSVNVNINDLLAGMLRTNTDTGRRTPVKDVKLYNTALSDAELIALTS